MIFVIKNIILIGKYSLIGLVREGMGLVDCFDKVRALVGNGNMDRRGRKRSKW